MPFVGKTNKSPQQLLQMKQLWMESDKNGILWGNLMEHLRQHYPSLLEELKNYRQWGLISMG